MERSPRERVAYRGGSSLAVPFPSDDDQRDDQDQRAEREDQDPDDTPPIDDDEQGDEDDGDRGGSRASAGSPGGGFAGAGAGWVLGMLLWGWVILPFVKGGPVQVKNTLRAKFLNQAADGSPLP